MNIQDILRQYPYIHEEIQKLQTELNNYNELQIQARCTLKAQCLTGMPMGGETSDQTLNAVETIIDRYQTEIDKRAKGINELIDRKNAIDEELLLLEHDERRILYLRFEQGNKINQIRYMMHLESRQQCYNIINSASKKILSKLDTIGHLQKKPV